MSLIDEKRSRAVELALATDRGAYWQKNKWWNSIMIDS